LRIGVLLIAIINAIFHGILVQFIQYSLVNGLYFLVTAILFAAGGIATVTSSKLSKIAAPGLLMLALMDNILIVITASFATPLSGGQPYGWGSIADINPPGQIPVFIVQTILILLTAFLLSKRKNDLTSKRPLTTE